MQFSNAAEVYTFLNGFINFERKHGQRNEYRLDRIRGLMERAGRPDRAIGCYHVAGSKGKGSTATMLAAVLLQRDGPIGLFTSPHLLHFTERIAIDGQAVSEAILLPAAVEMTVCLTSTNPQDYALVDCPTFFELLTLLAFLCFRLAGCRQAVIEVGLGGRLDTTNIIAPVACLLTAIELEHTEILGHTIELIAAEKAGIIKSGVPVFSSAQKEAAVQVFRATALVKGAAWHCLDDEVTIDDRRIDRSGSHALLRFRDQPAGDNSLTVSVGLIGDVQLRNAALVSLVARHFGYTPSQIQAGLLAAKLRARFEIIPGDPTVILDGAHTVDSVAACRDQLVRLFPEGCCLLFGCAIDKPAAAMAAVFGSEIKRLFVTKPGPFKESDPAAIAQAFERHGFAVQLVVDTAEAIRQAAAAARKSHLPLLVCGSFYLCAEVAAELTG